MTVNAIDNSCLKMTAIKGGVEVQDEVNTNNSLFETQETAKVEKTVENDENNVEDNDKLSFWDGVKAFFGGVKDKAVEQVQNVVKLAKKEPLLAGFAGLATVGLTALSVFCPPVAIGVGALAVLFGGYSLVKDIPDISKAIKEYKNSGSKDEAEAAIRNIGYEGLEAVEDVALMAAGTAQAVNALRAATAGIAFEDSLYTAGRTGALQGASSSAYHSAEIDAGFNYLRMAELERSAGISSVITGVQGAITSSDLAEDVLRY